MQLLLLESFVFRGSGWYRGTIDYRLLTDCTSLHTSNAAAVLWYSIVVFLFLFYWITVRDWNRKGSTLQAVWSVASCNSAGQCLHSCAKVQWKTEFRSRLIFYDYKWRDLLGDPQTFVPSSMDPQTFIPSLVDSQTQEFAWWTLTQR